MHNICILIFLLLHISCGDGDNGKDLGTIINGIKLTDTQIAEFEELYGSAVLPGNYWYDSAAGLIGKIGGHALAVIYPGHDLGTMSEDASGGDTGVYLNDRVLNRQEVDFLRDLYSSEIYQGRYYMNALGYVTSPEYPFFYTNLYKALQAKYQSDNGWSTKWGANGNSSGGCTYVNLPGSTGITQTTVTSGCG